MLAISQEPSRMSIKEYLEWEPQQDLRHEYINGEVFAMTGGTLAHNDITLNLYRTLYPQVRSRGCRINVADVKVQVTTNSPYYYPDVVVSCRLRATSDGALAVATVARVRLARHASASPSRSAGASPMCVRS